MTPPITAAYLLGVADRRSILLLEEIAAGHCGVAKQWPNHNLGLVFPNETAGLTFWKSMRSGWVFFVLSTPANRRSECGGTILQVFDQHSYVWDLVFGFDRTKVAGDYGATKLVEYFKGITQKEPVWFWWKRSNDLLFIDKTDKDNCVTRFYLRRRRLAKRAGESVCKLPELLEVVLYLKMMSLSNNDLTTVLSSLSDVARMTMPKVQQKLRTMYNERRLRMCPRRGTPPQHWECSHQDMNLESQMMKNEKNSGTMARRPCFSRIFTKSTSLSSENTK